MMSLNQLTVIEQQQQTLYGLKNVKYTKSFVTLRKSECSIFSQLEVPNSVSKGACLLLLRGSFSATEQLNDSPLPDLSTKSSIVLSEQELKLSLLESLEHGWFLIQSFKELKATQKKFSF